MTNATKIVAAAATALVLGTASPVMAQQPTPAPAPEQAQEEVTSDELERFARSYLEIASVAQGMEAQLAEVQDPTEAQEIQAEAQQEIVQALGQNDLTPERYQAVGAQINADPELQAELVEIIEDLRDDDSDGGR